MLRGTLFILIYSLFLLSSSFGQGGTWTWVNGENTTGSGAVFGTQGVPSVNNNPPAMYEPCEWKDKQGNFWIYGGWTPNAYSDLWKYNPVNNEWTWVKGKGLINQLPVYGTQGVPNDSNTPGERSFAAVTWIDTSGALWLFGGANRYGFQNDLWRYDIGTNEWTWVKGDTIADAGGVHGMLGVPSPLTMPGTRAETCSAWTDSLNNLWLFGGLGYDDNAANGFLNDLCKYNISTNEWTWVKGSALINAGANYGAKGVVNINNDPGARISYTKWKDDQGNLWLMGGMDENYNDLNDVWKFDLNLNEWTWMNGPNAKNDIGLYNSNCVFDTANRPYSRMEQRSAATDSCGRFWLFGGEDFVSNSGFNDLWVFDSQQLKWNWVNGTNAPNQAGIYGSIGLASAANVPPSRFGAVSWWGNDNKFYLFGGLNSNNEVYSDLWVFAADNNCLPACGALNFPPPVANFQSSQTTICANDCVNFTDLSSNAASWQWSFSGALDSTSNAENPQNVCYSKTGIYNVTLIVTNATGSDTVTFSNYITVDAAPPTPAITQHLNHDTLYCSFDTSYSTYQWYYDSTLIAGATDTFLVVSKNGNYNVEVTSKNGCKAAGGINVIIGIENYVNDNVVSIYPNPNSKTFTVYGLQFTVGRLEMYNVLGQICSQSETVNRNDEIIVDVSTFPAGIYFVKVSNESGIWVGKFIKE